MKFIDLYKGATLIAFKMFCVMVALLLLFPHLGSEAACLYAILIVAIYTEAMDYVYDNN